MENKQLGLVLVVVVADKQPPAVLVEVHSGVRAREILQQNNVRYPTVWERLSPEQLHTALDLCLGNTVDGALMLNELWVGSMSPESKHLLRWRKNSVGLGFEGHNSPAAVAPGECFGHDHQGSVGLD